MVIPLLARTSSQPLEADAEEIGARLLSSKLDTATVGTVAEEIGARLLSPMLNTATAGTVAVRTLTQNAEVSLALPE